MIKQDKSTASVLGQAEIRLLRTIARAQGMDINLVDLEKRRSLLASGAVEIFQGKLVVTKAGAGTLRRLIMAKEEDRIFASQHQLTAKLQTEDEPKTSCQPRAPSPLINHGESPLARLAVRKRPNGSPYLTTTQWEAGERLRRDFECAQLAPAMGINWDRLGQGGGKKAEKGSLGGQQDLSDTALQARLAFQKAQRAVGEELSRPLVDFCCYLKGLEEVEKSRGWPARSGKQIMAIALSALARHYGLGEVAQGPTQSSMRHWGSPDYRPEL